MMELRFYDAQIVNVLCSIMLQLFKALNYNIFNLKSLKLYVWNSKVFKIIYFRSIIIINIKQTILLKCEENILDNWWNEITSNNNTFGH